MAKKKNVLLTHGSLHVPLDQMMSIDIEGAPALVKQVSIYDFNHELLYNKTAPAGKELPQWEITKIQRILNRARVLVGHSLDSDLMALRRRGVYLYNDTRCLDTYFTLLEMKAEGLLDNRFNGATLKETALYFHIRANDYHTSHTDALAAAVVLQEMMKQGDGMVVEITPSIIQIPRPPFGMEPDWEKEERGDMQQNKIIGPKVDSRVYKIGDFYECVIAGGQGPTFVRMTQEEYDLFLRIRELRPDYTVRLYNETILTPSIVARLAALEEAEKAAEAAPVATVTEEVEVLDISEEPETLEEIEEAPVPALEEEPTEESAPIDEAEEQAEEAEAPISEEIEEMPLPASEKVTAEEIGKDVAPVEDIEEPTAAEEETDEEESGEEAPSEIVAPETEVEEAAGVEASEEGYSEAVAVEVEAPRGVSVEETDAEIISKEMAVAKKVEAPAEESNAAELAPEEAAAEAEAPAEEISCETEPAEVVETGGETPISYDVEEAPMDWPEESLEMASEMPQDGASEPLFGEGIWDLPEDFSGAKEKELPADEHKAEKKKDPAEEDAFSMSLFFEPEEESGSKA